MHGWEFLLLASDRTYPRRREVSSTSRRKLAQVDNHKKIQRPEVIVLSRSSTWKRHVVELGTSRAENEDPIRTEPEALEGIP